jgi:hypothetical protein
MYSREVTNAVSRDAQVFDQLISERLPVLVANTEPRTTTTNFSLIRLSTGKFSKNHWPRGY